jgi:hypothetical protein
MPSYKQGKEVPPKGNDLVAEYARKALEAFRADLPDAYKEIVKQYEGHAVSAGVFGMGMVMVAVQDGEVQINPKGKPAKLLGRGATYPETIAALATGKLTILDAYHKGDVAVQAARSSSLHDGYNRMIRYSDSALRSNKLQQVFTEFCKAARIDA